MICAHMGLCVPQPILGSARLLNHVIASRDKEQARALYGTVGPKQTGMKIRSLFQEQEGICGC